MKNFIINIRFVVALFFSFSLYGQEPNPNVTKIDSLLKLVDSKSTSNSQIDVLNHLSKTYLEIDYVKAEQYAREAIKKSELTSYKDGLAYGYYHLAYSVYYTIDVKTSLDYYLKALKLYREIKKPKDEIAVLADIAYIYGDIGDVENQLYYYRESELLAEKIGDKVQLGSIYNNLGNIFSSIDDGDKTIYYYEKSIALQTELNNENNLVIPYLNAGIYYMTKNDTLKALDYYKKGYNLAYEFNHLYGKIIANSRYGNHYYDINQLSLSQNHFEEGLKISKSSNHSEGIAISMFGLAKVNFKTGNYSKALEYAKSTEAIYDKLNNLVKKNQTYFYIYQIYAQLNDFKNAYFYQSKYLKTKDSLYSVELMTKVQDVEGKYQFEKKQLQIENLEIESEKKKMAHEKTTIELENQKSQEKLYIIGIILIMILLIGSVVAFIQKKKANFKINQQKIAVENQKTLIEKQHHLLEETHKEITDSIQYAKRIQAAILPPSKVVTSNLPNSFILYQPKDIVAGDFYWLELKNNKILIAAADCTGHGVPGAMVSVICNNGLNRSVREHGLTSPNEILNKTREIVIQEFEKSEDEVKDGMDISLCSIDFDMKNLEWAGANNPLWIIRNQELIEFKADKQPIGKYSNPLPFTNHSIELFKNDCLYIFTDGYADQFGGEKGKKFMSKNLKDLILSNSTLSMDEQKSRLEKEFSKWKGANEQIDDVCIIGIRI